MQEQEERESTSIKILPSIWQNAKIEAIRDNIQLSEFVEEAVYFWNKRRKEFKK